MPKLIRSTAALGWRTRADFFRPYYRSHIQKILEQSRDAVHPSKCFALLLVDLDRFQELFDLCGPEGVDMMRDLLVQDRLKQLNQATIVHMTGGTFVCLLPYDEHDDLIAFIDRLRDVIGKPMWINRHVIYLTASIGVVVANAQLWADDLLHAASVALSQAQRAGSNKVSCFREEMYSDLQARAELETDFHSGLRLGQIVPFYQPIVGLTKGVPKGFEALARWQHPRLGLLSPDRFLSVASDLDLGGDMLLLLLRQICRDAQDWPPHLTASINISPVQLCDPVLVRQILRIIYASGIAPSRLTIEITEEASIDNPVAAGEAITALRKAGLGIALDDFGSGHASFDRLSHLEIDQLKIDRSLVQAMDKERGRKLVGAIAHLGHSLSMKVTAEGIETAEHERFAQDAQCNWGQGYLYGEPVPAETARMVAQGKAC